MFNHDQLKIQLMGCRVRSMCWIHCKISKMTIVNDLTNSMFGWGWLDWIAVVGSITIRPNCQRRISHNLRSANKLTSENPKLDTGDDYPRCWKNIWGSYDFLYWLIWMYKGGGQKKNVPFSSLLLLRGPATPPPLSSPVGN